MAAIVSAAIVYAGAAIGATALAGLGVYAGISVGAVIGAGIAGGIMAEVKGGDFWDGFGVAALTSGVFQAFSGPMAGIGGAEGAGGIEGTTGGTYDAGGTFTPEASSFDMGPAPITETGMGDVNFKGVSSAQGPGFGEIGTDTSYGFNNQLNTPSELPQYTPPASAGQPQAPQAPTHGQGTFLQGSPSSSPAPTSSLEGTSSGGSINDLDSGSLGQSMDGGGGTQDFSVDYNLGSDYNSSSGLGPTMGEGSGASGATNTSGGGLKSMFNQGDQWLGENLGMPRGSTALLSMQGGLSLYDMYNAKKMEDMAAGLAPMSFDDYQSKYGNLPGYRAAGRKLAQAGRTGALPTLLARQKADIGNQYNMNYLPKAQQGYNAAQIQAMNAGTAAPRGMTNMLGSLWLQGRKA